MFTFFSIPLQFILNIFKWVFTCILLILFFPFKGVIKRRLDKKKKLYARDPKCISDSDAHIILKDLAWEEFNNGNLDQAVIYSNELLRLNSIVEENWNYGNAIHHSHTILGLVSLESFDLANAKKHLLLSSRTPGSPQLNTFGPRFTLAQKLINLEEYETVEKYLINCRRFWNLEKGRISRWLEEIESGKKPQFERKLKK